MSKPFLRLKPAIDAESREWAAQMVIENHYLHTRPDPRTRPLCYLVEINDVYPVGCLWFGRPESTRCYVGGLTYGSLADVQAGRAAHDRWEVLNLSRVWFSADVQAGGRLHDPKYLPGFVDRRGVFRSTLASTAIAAALARIGFDYLNAYLPCFLEQPYVIRAVLSYCNTYLHRGVIYRAAGFSLARANKEGIETWWTPAVLPLTELQDRVIRRLSKRDPRAKRIRAAAAGLAAQR
jgi:hypothetical protein